MTPINRTPRSIRAIAVFAVLIAILAFTVAAHAQAQWAGTFTLPYEVHWNNAVLPAGEYNIRIDSTSKPVVVRSMHGDRQFVTTVPIISSSEQGAARILLTFAAGEHTVRSLNAPALGVSFVFKAISRAEREEFAKAGGLESVPLTVAKK